MQKTSMLSSRYGHASILANGYVLVFGGFNHREVEGETPITLSSCEKYSEKEDSWS
jgi:hypothetical protein